MSQAITRQSTQKQAVKLPSGVPALYRPLAPLLNQLSEEMLQVLTGPLSSLASLSNPFAAQEFEDQGDFAGLAGLDRQGDLHRLAHSEWLLQGEIPDEFLRRLLENEALYQQPLFENPGKRQVARLILDAGPHSLGLPRLLQLAVLLHLSVLAQRARVDLVWAVAGEQEKSDNDTAAARARDVWQRNLDHQALRSLLRSSVIRPTTAQSLFDLYEREKDSRPANEEVSVEDEPPMDFLLCPMAAIPEQHPQTNLLLFSSMPRDEQGRAQMTLVQRLAGQAQEERQIKLPKDTLCLAALRRPLEPALAITNLLARRADPAAWPKVERAWAPKHYDFATRAKAVARYQNYFLVLGHEAERSYAIPLPDDCELFGYRLTKRALLLWLCGTGASKSPGIRVADDHMELQIHALERGLPTGHQTSHYAPLSDQQFSLRFGPFDLPALPFADKSHVTFHDAKHQRFIAHFDGRNIKASQDSRSLIMLSTRNDRALYTGSRGLRLASLAESRANTWPSANDHAGFDPDLRSPRSFLYNPQQQILSLTNDGQHWQSFHQHSVLYDCQALKEDQRALHFSFDNRRFKALVYSDPDLGGNGRLYRWDFLDETLEDYGQRDFDARLTQVRYDPLSREVWAAWFGDTGQVEGLSLMASAPKTDGPKVNDYVFADIVERRSRGAT